MQDFEMSASVIQVLHQTSHSVEHRLSEKRVSEFRLGKHVESEGFPSPIGLCLDTCLALALLVTEVIEQDQTKYT